MADTTSTVDIALQAEDNKVTAGKKRAAALEARSPTRSTPGRTWCGLECSPAAS